MAPSILSKFYLKFSLKRRRNPMYKVVSYGNRWINIPLKIFFIKVKHICNGRQFMQQRSRHSLPHQWPSINHKSPPERIKLRMNALLINISHSQVIKMEVIYFLGYVVHYWKTYILLLYMYYQYRTERRLKKFIYH